MFVELKTELNASKHYLDTLKLLENEECMQATKEAIEHALNLIKLLNERVTIAEAKSNNAPLPVARSWKDIKLEYEAVYHLERLYNNNEDISNL